MKTTATVHQQATYRIVLVRDCEAEDLELRVLFSKQLLTIVGTEQSDRPEFMVECVSQFKPYLHLRENLFNNIHPMEILSTHSEPKVSATSIYFSNNFLTPFFLLATSELCETAQH